MQKRLVRLVVLSLAFAWVWLTPAWARAALVPICDAPANASLMPPVPEPACMVVTSVDDSTGETSAAPICDPRGASAIAPQRVLPVSDARLDASPTCGEDPSAVAVTSRRGNAPSGQNNFAVGELGVPCDAFVARPE